MPGWRTNRYRVRIFTEHCPGGEPACRQAGLVDALKKIINDLCLCDKKLIKELYLCGSNK
ncbi:MAG: hypothetical protein WKF59_13410 [Chitinophagaceae bacterium]